MRLTSVSALVAAALVAALCGGCDDSASRSGGTRPSELRLPPLPLDVHRNADGTVLEQEITAAELGSQWPLTPSNGILRVRQVSRFRGEPLWAVLFVHGGSVYALNGTARGRMLTYGWEDALLTIAKPDERMRDIYKRTPQAFEREPTMDLSPLIQVGLELGRAYGRR